MNKLLNPNRQGGFPLTGEALEILSEQPEKWLKAIFDAGVFPLNGTELIFFRNSNYPISDSSIKDGELVYSRHFGFCELTNVTALNINYLDLINNIVFVMPVIADIVCDDTNQLGTFAATRKYQRLSLSISENSLFRVYDFKELLKWQCFSVSKEVDLTQCRIYFTNNGDTIGFDANNNLIGATQYNNNVNQWTTFVGVNNYIHKVGSFLKIHFSYSGSPAGGSNNNEQYFNIIELPTWVRVDKIISLRCVIDNNNINAAINGHVSAIIYLNYIIIQSTTGVRHSISDVIPIEPDYTSFYL